MRGRSPATYETEIQIRDETFGGIGNSSPLVGTCGTKESSKRSREKSGIWKSLLLLIDGTTATLD